ncbi:MAG: leucine-rich repeat protein [Oscillospiraceae bacterium]|nr:leucine-rich repeat protein [Oscillospiraceae bacterium]
MKKFKQDEKKTIIRVIMFIAAVAMILSFVILPVYETVSAEEVTDVVVASFDTGSLSSAIETAKDGTDLNNITSLCISGGTLDEADYEAIRVYPNVTLIDLSGADTKDGIVPDGALSSRNKLDKVYLPKNTEEIGASAFAQDRVLEQVYMPNTVRKIGDHAFEGCEKAAHFDIPAQVTYIGEGAFRDCKALADFVLPAGVTEISDDCFAQTALTSFVVGPQVTSVGARAFENCHGLADLYCYGDAPSLGEGAFQNCKTAVHAVDGSDGYEQMQSAASNWLTVSYDLKGEYTAPEPTDEPAQTSAEESGKAEEETSQTEKMIEETSAETSASQTTASEETAVSSQAEQSKPAQGFSTLSVVIIAVLCAAVGALSVLAFRKK